MNNSFEEYPSQFILDYEKRILKNTKITASKEEHIKYLLTLPVIKAEDQKKKVLPGNTILVKEVIGGLIFRKNLLLGSTSFIPNIRKIIPEEIEIILLSNPLGKELLKREIGDIVSDGKRILTIETIHFISYFKELLFSI